MWLDFFYAQSIDAALQDPMPSLVAGVSIPANTNIPPTFELPPTDNTNTLSGKKLGIL
jgi:hypothetical protein